MDWFRKTIEKLRGSGGLPEQDFVIVSAEARRDADPRTFSIPRSEQRRTLKVGDSVKILLEARNPSGPITAERPWVLVSSVEPNGRYKVSIDNSLVLFPNFNDATLEIGPEHVISVELPDEYILPFGKSCRVSASVLGDDAWPHVLVRTAPEDEGDSGWRIFSDTESLADASLVEGCDRLISMYQVLDSVMDEPAQAHWSWQKTENEYARVSR